MLLKEKGRVISASGHSRASVASSSSSPFLRCAPTASVRGVCFARKARNSNIESTEGGRGGVVWRNH
jgi:hypothetical protein